MYRKLQELLKEQQIDYYIVPTDDAHQSEYVSDHDQFRRYLSHFTGSAGTLIVSQDNAWLWADGRYYIQAARQLPKGITLMKYGMPDVPTVSEFLISHLQAGETLGFNGKVMAAATIYELEEEIEGVTFLDCDLSFIWEDRPPLPHEKVYLYDFAYHGCHTEDKLAAIRDKMRENDCTLHLMTQLDDIAWTFNIRGNDIEDTPVALAFALITLDDATLYLQAGTYDEALVSHFARIHVTIADYEDIYEDVEQLTGTMLLNLRVVNFALASRLDVDYVDAPNPSQLLKAVKNDVEIANAKNAHLKDGIALTKFMYYLKTTALDEPQTEMSLSDALLSYRQAQPLFVEPSFATICAYGENGAIIHYQATPEHNAAVLPGKMLMIDSGGQYLDGTTDVTRTFVLGDISAEEKHDFTIVLKSFLALQGAVFLKGTNCAVLDMIARKALWEDHKDYRHGTGHGVGHFLGVHEGPQNIRYKPASEPAVMLEGMITSDEPGFYEEGRYGIRHENLILCVKDHENAYGTYLRFEPLTLCPIDLDGVDVNLLNADERKLLNLYHSQVYNKISPYLTQDEKEWLKNYTRSI